MYNHFVSRVPAEELDRRNSTFYQLVLTGFSFVASVIVLSLGVMFVNISKVVESIRITGGLYIAMGLVFLVAGTLLALTLATKKKIFSNVWFGAVGVLICLHVIDLGFKISALVENGQKPEPDIEIAFLYAALFALGYGSIIVQAFCIGFVLYYRSVHYSQPSEPEKYNTL